MTVALGRAALLIVAASLALGSMVGCRSGSESGAAGPKTAPKTASLRTAGDEATMIDTWLASGAKPARATAYTALPTGKWKTLLDVDGPGIITHIWFTFPAQPEERGRQTLLRMYWDNESDPSVEAPITDFFGIPFGWTGEKIKLASHYLVVVPTNGLNCYFPMPFAKHAKIEVLHEGKGSGAEFYSQVDYARFSGALPDEYAKLRFHAQFRFENPCEAYGRNYLVLDAKGKGALVGVTLGVQIRQPELDWWVHGGGDTVLLDAETDPSILHGIGLEDYFGQAWGVQATQSSYVGAPYVGGGKICVYRFYVRDPVVFHSSIRLVMGALPHAYSSVAYWYQEEPHQRFFSTPDADSRMPDAEAPYGTYDVEAEGTAEWRLLAPLKLDAANPFDAERPFEAKETGAEHFVYEAQGQPTLPGGNKLEVTWKAVKAYNDFVDFNTVARPAVSGIRPQAGVVGYAVRTIECAKDEERTIRVGFDDQIAVRINDSVVFAGTHANGFRGETFRAKFRKGTNRVLVKLSNEDNDNWRSWAFSFYVGQ